MLKLLQLTAAECASSTSETTSESQRKSKIPHPATGGQTARIPGITRFSIPVHSRIPDSLINALAPFARLPAPSRERKTCKFQASRNELGLAPRT